MIEHNSKTYDLQRMKELLIEKAIRDAKEKKEAEERSKEVLFDTLNYYLQGRGIVISNYSS